MPQKKFHRRQVAKTDNGEQKSHFNKENHDFSN